VIGIIDAVSKGSGGLTSQITVRNKAGIQSVVWISPDTKIIGKDGNPTTLSWVRENKASIEYIMPPKGGTRTATLITVLSDV